MKGRGRRPVPWKTVLWLITATVGLLILPEEHRDLIFRVRSEAAYGEFTYEGRKTLYVVTRNASAAGIDAGFKYSEIQLIRPGHSGQTVEIPPEALVPPVSSGLILVKRDSLASEQRMVTHSNGRIFDPRELILLTEREDLERFALVLLLAVLSSITTFYVAVYISERAGLTETHQASESGGEE